MFAKIQNLPLAVKQYAVITGNYWAFTLTDGALRMLILLHFYQLGYAPLALAMLFVFYEVFGVITNLIGGWLGARVGLNKTMNIGLFMQVFALLMLAIPSEYLSVIYLMTAQALSGVAKDLNKMSAKSSIKLLVANVSAGDREGTLFKWVALLTGSKNTLKGVGFFLGGFLLTTLGFQGGVLLMAAVLAVVALLSVTLLKKDFGIAKFKPKFTDIFSKNRSLNYLSAARLCLFAARDVWFVIALPVFLASQLEWQHQSVGAFFALWIIAYGAVQAYTPNLFNGEKRNGDTAEKIDVNGRLIALWSTILAVVILMVFISLAISPYAEIVILLGLLVFGGIFAINSSLHSYLIVALAKEDGVSMDVGFYYTANALGRLLGTVLSGLLYQALYTDKQGLLACLLASFLLSLAAAFFIKRV
ncbi:organoarsenical effux MFS transporter ArsJ [Colwellia sp. KU-HH00111]|uniref:organoarsenical effux MFS transporter ArsJ n=1 Tax=Colwellia sp. KU-HH00111 TaxID=3127652 RepID=UPI00310A91A5